MTGIHKNPRLPLALPPSATAKFIEFKQLLESSQPVPISLENTKVAEAAFELALQVLKERYQVAVARTPRARFYRNANKGQQDTGDLVGNSKHSQMWMPRNAKKKGIGDRIIKDTFTDPINGSKHKVFILVAGGSGGEHPTVTKHH